MIMGLGAQLIAWPDEFVAAFVERGHFAIRYDNRDVGLSTKLDESGGVNLVEMIGKIRGGESPEVPYLLRDMADDAAGLLDALGLESAHVVGASMGGAIAQQLTIAHPTRVRSLTSIMATSGNPELPQAKPEVMARLLRPAPSGREATIENRVELMKAHAGSGFPVDEGRARELAGRSFDRCHHPAGQQRQLAAVLASGSRRDALRSVKVPTLVIHGSEDPLVPVEGGIDTHEAIPGSELLLIEGMGHGLPQGTWPTIVDAVSKHTSYAVHG